MPIKFKKILFFYGEFSSRPPDHHLAPSGGPTEVLVDWGHRTTLISTFAIVYAVHFFQARVLFILFLCELHYSGPNATRPSCQTNQSAERPFVNIVLTIAVAAGFSMLSLVFL